MGAGLAMKRGNARGVKVRTAKRPVPKRDRRYAKSGKPMSTNIARIGEKKHAEHLAEEPDVGKLLVRF